MLVLCLLQLCCVVTVFYARSTCCVCTNEQASIYRVVLGFSLLDLWYILFATYSFHGRVSIRGEHRRKGAGCDVGTCALTGRLRGTRPSAGCGHRRCCNVLRELASFVVPMCFVCLPQATLLETEKRKGSLYDRHNLYVRALPSLHIAAAEVCPT